VDPGAPGVRGGGGGELAQEGEDVGEELDAEEVAEGGEALQARPQEGERLPWGAPSAPKAGLHRGAGTGVEQRRGHEAQRESGADTGQVGRWRSQVTPTEERHE